MNSSNQASHNLHIDVFCDVPSEHLEALKLLIDDLWYISMLDEMDYLKRVSIVSDLEVAGVVAELLQKAPDEGVASMQVEGIPQGAIPIPVSDDGCILIVGERYVRSISPEQYHPFDTVSALLGGLLRARLYAKAQRVRGYILSSPSLTSGDSMLAISNIIHHEYVLKRWKAAIMESAPIIDSEEGVTVGQLMSGASLFHEIDTAGKRLKKIVVGAGTGALPIQAAWQQFGETVRDLFTVLAHDAAYRAGTSDAPTAEDELSESQFYRDHIAPYWRRMKAELERSFDSELQEIDSATKGIAVTLKEFLGHIGVTVYDESAYVYFDARFFDSLET
jgi:hypothetical protein